MKIPDLKEQLTFDRTTGELIRKTDQIEQKKDWLSEATDAGMEFQVGKIFDNPKQETLRQIALLIMETTKLDLREPWAENRITDIIAGMKWHNTVTPAIHGLCCFIAGAKWGNSNRIQ